VVAFGDDKITNVVENAATQAGNVVEVRITYDATNNSKRQALKALETLASRITKGPWPPI
jgi:hypothetical protein